MVLGGAMPAGSSRDERLDPLALPVRFTASDAGADGRVRHVELDRERVVLRRAVRGIRMAVKLPVAAFLGVALRLVPSEGERRPISSPSGSSIAITRLSVPLFAAPDGDDVVAEWQPWGRVLRLPLLVAEADGTLREPFRQHRRAVASRPRRRGGGGATPSRRAGRRSCCGGKPGRLAGGTAVHRGEREIIARELKCIRFSSHPIAQRGVEHQAGEQDQAGVAVRLEQRAGTGPDRRCRAARSARPDARRTPAARRQRPRRRRRQSPAMPISTTAAA